MNTIRLQRTVFVVSFAALAGVGSALPGNAQPTNAGIDSGMGDANFLSPNQPAILAPTTSQTQLPELESASPSVLLSAETSTSVAPEVQTAIAPNQLAKTQPVPGTSATSADVLLHNSPNSSQTPHRSRVQKEQQIAQEVEPGRSTRSGSSYVGIGGNIGLTGDTALGDSGFALFSKIGLTRNFSVRPSVVISGDADFIIPLTFDFPIQAEPFERISFAPYAGAGVIISTDNDQNIGLALTGGVDVPISERFTATGAVTAGFLDTTDLGITVGIGYNFGPGFRFE